MGFLVVSLGVMLGILSGAWSGSRAKWAWIYLGAVMILDLGRADSHGFIILTTKRNTRRTRFWSFSDKTLIEHRVAERLSPIGPNNISGNRFNDLYQRWLQNDFPYHNIQALDFAQWPRMPLMDSNYLGNFICKGTNLIDSDMRPAVRLFELTNTRFILANAGSADLINDRGDPVRRGFQVRARLNIGSKVGVAEVEDLGDLNVEIGEDGPYALIEFTHALPRAKLYVDWKSSGDDAATLRTLASPDFVPWQTVLLAAETPATQRPPGPGSDPGTVTINDYMPKYLKLQANSRTPAVLLLNDRFSPDWKVFVDGKAAPLLRCNYIMRGVFLSSGEHTIEFRFRPPLGSLYVSLGAWVAGILVAGYVFSSTRKIKTGKQD